MSTVSSLRTIFLILFLVTLSLAGFSQPEGYGYGKQVTIDAAQVAGGSPLANFPVMIRFMGATADLNLRTFANGGHVENINGYDIIFTADQAGLTVLNHQIESYNPVTGEYVAWVRIPSLSNSVNTTLYMYYGNCTVSVNPSTTAVWNSDFDAVYQLHNNFNDATANGNNATNSGSTNTSPGIIGDGQNFVNVVSPGDHIQAPSASISAGQATLSIWLNASSFSANHQYIFGHTTTPPFANRIQLYVNNVTGLLDLGLGNSHNTNINFFDLNTAEWYYVALTWNGTNYVVYVNGVAQASGAYAGLSSLNTFLDIGNNGNSATRNETWIGDLDHARFSNEVFSADWILTEYNNQRTGSTFYTVGSEVATVRTFYSRASGAWESNLSWSFSSDGSSGAVPVGVLPRRADNVVIQSGHTITINNTSDNGSCPVSPDGLGMANVGPFISSNVPMFYQAGDITIAGTLNVTGIEMMVSGYTHIVPAGTFSLASYLVNVGYFEADAASTLTTLDDFVVTGNSTTIINTNSTSADDLIVDHTDAILCGIGTATLQNGGGSSLTYTNGATVNQVCTTFTINCSGVGCDPSFPVVGTNPIIIGNTGPGGVGNQNVNKLWLMANNGSFSDNGVTAAVNNATVQQWNDQSGNGNNAIQNTAGNRPIFRTGQDNGLPALQFTGDLFIDVPALGIAGTSSAAYLIAFRDTQAALGGFNDGSGDFILDRTTATNALMSLKPVTGSFYGFQKRDDGGGGLGGVASTTPINTNTKWIEMAHQKGISYSLFYNGSQESTTGDGDGNLTPPNVRIGRHATTTNGGLRGFIHEFMIYSSVVNNAQRVLINNYISAKYNVTLSVNDVYTMDNPANGNFDFEVAGIGQASDGSNHKDAKGSGVVRMWNPNNLTNSEFLMWGHNGLNFSGGNTTDVDNVIIQERISRVWRVSEVGDVGTTFISVDMSGTLGMALGNNLRLLIDRDGDGFADNDVTPISGSFSGGIVTFSGVNLQNGDRFTIGNTNFTLPLPIQLISFEATAHQAEVKLAWSTASELNNDFFTIQRSQEGEVWQDVVTVKGAGTRSFRTEYETSDGLPFNGVSYYRLKQTDFDKQYSYSQVRRVELNNEFQLKVYPNPSNGTFTVSTGFEITLDNIRLINSVGQSIPIQLQSDQSSATLTSQSVAPGIYIVQVNKGYWRQSVRVVIQ